MMASRTIASPSEGCILRTTRSPMRTAPLFLAWGPPLHPVWQPRVAVVLRSRNLCICSTSPAMHLAAPLFLLKRPFSLPIGEAIGTIVWVDCAQHRRRRISSDWAGKIAFLATPPLLVQGPCQVVAAPTALIPEQVCEKHQEQQQRNEHGQHQAAIVVPSTNAIVAPISLVPEDLVHRVLAPSSANILEPSIHPCAAWLTIVR